MQSLQKPVKLWDDACFIGETLITTKRGLVPIKDIKPNEDHVLTSKGYKKVLKDRKSTRLNSSHSAKSRMPSSA